MIILGITGSIGSGKSYISSVFKRFSGVVCYSSDKMVHRLFAEDKKLQKQISEHFPEAVNNDNIIDRKKLGDIVFFNEEKKRLLESFIYPKLKSQRKKAIHEAIRKKTKILIFDIPLLFENNLDTECDFVLTVFCNDIIQRQRVLKRKGMSKEKFNNILKSL